MRHVAGARAPVRDGRRPSPRPPAAAAAALPAAKVPAAKVPAALCGSDAGPTAPEAAARPAAHGPNAVRLHRARLGPLPWRQVRSPPPFDHERRLVSVPAEDGDGTAGG